MIKMINDHPSFMDTPKSWRVVCRSNPISIYRHGIDNIEGFKQWPTIIGPKEMSYWEASDD